MIKNSIQTMNCWVMGSVLIICMCAFSGCVRTEEKAFLESIRNENEIADTPSLQENPHEPVLQTDSIASDDGDRSEKVGSDDDIVAMMISEQETMIFVDICGAVRQPGVYQLKADARVFELIDMAGGFTEEAADVYINRADHLSDGQKIYVPTKAELEECSEGQSQLNLAKDLGIVMQSVNFGESNSSEVTENDLININEAGLEDLITLPGIGESKALAIIAYREENGAFSSVDEITSVPGIKGGTFDKIKDGITTE